MQIFYENKIKKKKSYCFLDQALIAINIILYLAKEQGESFYLKE